MRYLVVCLLEKEVMSRGSGKQLKDCGSQVGVPASFIRARPVCHSVQRLGPRIRVCWSELMFWM
jgi:hypothetical protein